MRPIEDVISALAVGSERTCMEKRAGEVPETKL
jgi:hypothetical protein